MNATDLRTVGTIAITTSYPQAVHNGEGPGRHCDDRGPARLYQAGTTSTATRAVVS